MPVYFRKSIRLAKGVRMNLSKSGIGFSAGTRGCRVSTGPRGTYVSVGAGGVYYRQRIDRPTNQSFPAHNSPEPFVSYQTAQAIPTADAQHLVDATSSATLEALNTTIKQPAYAWIFVAGGFALACATAFIHPILFVLVFAFGLYLGYVANQFDDERRTYSLEFNLDEAARQQWIATNTAFATLARSNRIWRIITTNSTYDWKRNAGATSLLNRVQVLFTQHAARYIKSNLTPYCLGIGAQTLFFFPDRIYVYQNGMYGAVEYTNLQIDTGKTNFIENEAVPSDAQIVGSTWQYVNKNGGPDRRFNNNRQLSIANYGVIELKSSIGMNIILHVSSSDLAQQFGTQYRNRLVTSAPNKPRPTSQQSRSPGTQPPPSFNNQQYAQRPAPTPQQPNCYKVLGLLPSCTKEELDKKYRELATSHHPDRVNHMAQEFKTLAHQRMAEINQAYAELKRLRGW